MNSDNNNTTQFVDQVIHDLIDYVTRLKTFTFSAEYYSSRGDALVVKSVKLIRYLIQLCRLLAPRGLKYHYVYSGHWYNLGAYNPYYQAVTGKPVPPDIKVLKNLKKLLTKIISEIKTILPDFYEEHRELLVQITRLIAKIIVLFYEEPEFQIDGSEPV